MTFARKLAGLALFVLAASFASAQHGAMPAGHVANGALASGPRSSGAVGRASSAARYVPQPPVVGLHSPLGRMSFVHSPITPLSASSRFALQNAPAAAWDMAALRQGRQSGPQRFLGGGFGFRQQARRWPHFPYFFFGGGPSACSPLLPGFFGAPWFDRQFTCFETPFYGVDFYPEGFLAPELAYEPWLPNLPAVSEQQMYSVGDEALLAGDLDMTAAIAARESAESNPSQQVTILVLKEGIDFGVVDYWVDGGKLGYVTTYGRQNTIDLDRLDLDKTVKLNSSRGIPFVLSERATPAVPPPPQ